VFLLNRQHHTDKLNFKLMQAIAICATLGKTITLCSIYPAIVVNSTDLENLTAQLPPPILLIGEFNANSTLWGCSKTDH